MNRPIRTLMVCACILSVQASFSQKSWTLQECIDYAISHNIDLQKQEELINQREIQLNTAENARLPHLSADISNDFLFHNSLSIGITALQGNLPNSADMVNLSGTLNALMPVYDAGRIRSQRQSAKFALESALAQQNQARKDIGILVAVQYLEVLYYQGMSEVSRRQVDLSRDLVLKAEKQVNEGIRPESELAQAQSQLAADEYQLSLDAGNEQIATIKLAQLLMLEDVSSFQVFDPSLNEDIPMVPLASSSNDLFEEAVENYPSILAAKADISAADANVKMEKSNGLPSLDLVASIGTQSYSFFDQTLNSMTPDFFHLLGDNHVEMVSLRLNIPIFAGYQTRNAVRLSRSQVIMQQLSLYDERLRLRTEIEQAYYNASVACSHHSAAVKAELAAHTNYDYQLKSYDAGRTTIFDLNMVNQQWLESQQNVLQSKYDYLIRLKILDFYLSDNFVRP